jgi:formate hydrogenlyase subunit 3/multisubunit Na+/H+ antiporter MnhD subunit
MLKIWLGAFWAAAPATPLRWDAAAKRMTAVILALTTVSLTIGLNPQPLLRLATHAAGQTLDRPGYVARVQAANTLIVPGKHPAAPAAQEALP